METEGWSYTSETYETGYFLNDEWKNGSFDKAVEKLAKNDSGATKLNRADIEGSVFFSEEWISLSFDQVYFKESDIEGQRAEKNIRELVVLLKRICNELCISYMGAGPESLSRNSYSEPECINGVLWANYFSNESYETNQVRKLDDLFAELSEVDGGVFVFTTDELPTASIKARKTVEEINKKRKFD